MTVNIKTQLILWVAGLLVFNVTITVFLAG